MLPERMIVASSPALCIAAVSVVGWAVIPALARSPSGGAQGPPIVPGSPEKSVVIASAEAGPYEGTYGRPIMMSACTLLAEANVPKRQSIRTFGRFDPGYPARRRPDAAPGSTETPRPTCDATGPAALVALGSASSCERPTFDICCEERVRECLHVTPVPEIAVALEAAARSFRDQRVMVVGAFEDAVFNFWDFQVMADFGRRKEDGRDSGLRAVVAAAGAGDGDLVRVRG